MVEEFEAQALRAFVDGRRADRLVSSALARTELQRAVLRFSSRPDVTGDQAQAASAEASAVLRGVDLVRVGAGVLDRAGYLPPPQLRSLDAIHLATALALGPRLGAALVYDARLADAARTAGLAVEAPYPAGGQGDGRSKATKER